MSKFLCSARTRLSRFGSLAFLLFALLVSGAINAQELNYQIYNLENGLEVILVEDHSKPEVFGLVGTKAGAKNDPKDATGMAHYQEHMLFKGTTELGTSDWAKEKVHIDRIFELYDELGATKDEEKRAAIQQEINKESVAAGKYTILNETSALIKQMGGTNLNAGTGWDQTVYYNAFPPSQTARWIDLYSHRFLEPVFRGFQAELEVVYEEKNMYDDNFITPLLNAVNSKIYKKHPYGQQTIIGTTEDLKNPSLTKMYDFFKKNYVASNMAVVLVGDFDSKEVMPMIKEKFGRLPKGEPIKFDKPIEEPFNGREYGEGKYSPVRLVMLAFRSVENGNDDELALAAFNTLLSNENGTGALNKLAQDGKVMEAQVMPMHHNDYGAEIFFVVPKIVGQKMDAAEEIVLNEVKRLRDGDFTDEDLNAIKKAKYRNYTLSLESNETRATAFFDVFARGGNYEDLLKKGEKINALTKEDLMRVAKKYYGDNYLAFFSKMGFPKKNKLEKPNYEPVSTNTNAKSIYAKHFEGISETKLEPAFIDFKKDMEVLNVEKGVEMYYTKNDLNDIFDFSISFGVGDADIREASFIAELFNASGTSTKTKSELKEAFDQLGCTYYFVADANDFTLYISGLEENAEKAIALGAEILNNPKVEEASYDVAREGVAVGRKMEREEPANIGQALLGYVLYGEKSKQLNRMSKKEMKKFNDEQLMKGYEAIKKYSAEIHYVGAKNPEAIKKAVKNNFKFATNPIISPEPTIIKRKQYAEDQVIFVPVKDAVQASIYFVVNGDKSDISKVPGAEAFNLYFGGGFSGLVLQEIREYRSMAYTASGTYVAENRKGMNDIFIGYVGTQADKAVEAIKIYDGLLKDMPSKPERISFIKPFMAQTAASSLPDFRNLTSVIRDYQFNGYDHDPSKDKYEFAKNMKFEDIENFYEENLKGKPRVIVIVGDPKRIDMDLLEKYGKVVEYKEDDLFND